MSRIDDFPVGKIVWYFEFILSRSCMWSPAKDLRETAGTMMIYPSLDEARFFWAAWKWLEIYKDVDVGVEQTRFDLKECIQMLSEKVSEMKGQGEEKVVTLTRRDFLILKDSTTHLDRFSISKDVASNKRSAPKGARKK